MKLSGYAEYKLSCTHFVRNGQLIFLSDLLQRKQTLPQAQPNLKQRKQLRKVEKVKKKVKSNCRTCSFVKTNKKQHLEVSHGVCCNCINNCSERNCNPRQCLRLSCYAWLSFLSMCKHGWNIMLLQLQVLITMLTKSTFLLLARKEYSISF